MANLSVEMVYLPHMYPVLANIGSFQVSTFGIMLALGIFFGGFSVWRIARGYEFDSEKILDLIFIVIGAGIVTSRITFVLTNLANFDRFSKIFFINTYPGLSFWGGLAGGLLAINWLAKKNKVSFLNLGDFAVVGFFIAAFFAEVGCLLGGCGVGIETNLFFGVNQIGVIGSRFPIQFIEAVVFLFTFFSFWKSAIKFHVQGALLAKGLIFIGIIKIFSGFFKEQNEPIKIGDSNLNVEFAAAAAVIAIGLRIYYSVYRKTPLDDLKLIWKLISSRKTQTLVLAKISRGWYNYWVNLWVKMGKGKKKLFKLFHIKPNPDNF